jgi:O-antigen ligase
MKTPLLLTKEKGVGLALGGILALIYFTFGAVNTVKIMALIVGIRLMIINPIYGIGIFIIGIPFLSDINKLLLGIGVVIFYGINFIKKGKFNLKKIPAGIPLLMFAILIVINTALSIDVKGSFRDFALYMVSFAILFMLIQSEKSKKQLYYINVVLVLTATVISIYGIYQFIVGVPMGSGWVDPTLNPDIKTRVYATFENPNLLAEYLIMAFPVSLALLLYSNKFVDRLKFAVTSIVMLIAIGLTYSRGGFLGLAFGIFVYFLYVNRKAILAMIPFGIAGLLVMPDSIIQRIKTIGSLQDSSNFYRFNLWNKAIDIINDFWYSGIGLGYIPFQKISPIYIRTMAPYHTHNTYLQIAIELGVIGLIIFLLLIFRTIKMGTSTILESNDRFYKIFTAAYVASLSGILLHGIAEHIFFNPKIILSFWLIVGILYSYYQQYKNESV